MFMIAITISGNLILGYILSEEATKKLIEGKQDGIYIQAKLLSQIYSDLVKPSIEDIAIRQYTSQKGEDKRTYDEILAEVRNNFLETPLRNYTKALNGSFEELGAGFYFTDLNKVVAFESNEKYIKDKKLVALVPISDDGSYIWVEESFNNINNKIKDIERKAFTPIIIVILCTLLFGIIFAISFTANIRKIESGLINVSKDLNYRLPNLYGEFGEISKNINLLAENLLKSRNRSELILESTKTGMIALDSNQEIVFINSSALNILEINRNSIKKDEKIIDILGPLIKGAINQAFSKNNTLSIDGLKVDPSEKEKFLNVSISPYNEKTNERFVLLTIEDITENVKLMKKAQKDESLKMLGLFTTGVAHEIRNPLTSIKGFVQLLNKRIEESSDNKRLINLVLREIERLESLIKDLIFYARPASPNFEWVCINETINDALQVLTQRISQKKAKLKIDIPDNILIYADRNQIYQAFFNLILNAVQAVKNEEGEINVNANIEPESKSIKIVISDNGCGIPFEDFSKIFTPFFTTKDKGVGLGLAISKKLIEDNNGKLFFESIYGEGTKFIIELPKYKIEECKEKIWVNR